MKTNLAVQCCLSLLIGAASLAAQPPSGDTARGKSLVESAGCLNCHRIGDKGSHTGPELSDIGDRRTPERLQKSLVAPDEEVLPENRFAEVVLKNGSTVRGRILGHDALSIQLMDTKDNLRSFPIQTVKSYTVLTKGLMPPQTKLPTQDIADIVSYLYSLKGN
jgi:putative heme-binding domain-containing protein